MERHLVAVYGSLRKTGWLHGHMEGCTFLGETKVPGRMYKVTNNYPAVVVDGIEIGDDEQVLVEVYEVDTSQLYLLDMVEGHPSYYRRINIPTEFGGTWMYVWTPDMVDPRQTRVEDGDWIKYWTSKEQ